MKNLLFFLAILSIILSSCAASAEPVATVPAPTSTLISPTATTRPTLTPTLPPTARPAPSATPGIAGIDRQCLEVSSDTQQLLGSPNGLIMLAQDRNSSEIYDRLQSPYLFNPATGTKVEIPGGSGFAVSLDNSQMAYVSQDDRLIITDATGKQIKQRPFPDVQIIHWAKNGLIVEDTDRQQTFINPFTGERKKLAGNFPNLYPAGYGLDPYWGPEILYNPSFTRAIYPAQDPQSKDTYISIWNIANNQEVVNLSRSKDLFAPGWRPEWSVDGNQVIIVADEIEQNVSSRKLVSINQDGIIAVIMNLDIDMAALYYALSPSQEYVAFWSPDPQSFIQIRDLDLHVVNIKTGKVINYCIISPEITFQPIWSADSTQLLVELKKDMGSSDVVLVDMVKNIAVKIAENAQPVGWLK